MRERFKNLKVGKKLTAAFSIILILYSITIATAFVNISSMSSRMEGLHEGPFANVELALKMVGDIQEVGRQLLLMASDNSTEDTATSIANVREMVARVEKNMDTLKENYKNGARDVNEFIDSFEEMKIPRDEILALLEEGRTDEALVVYMSDYSPKAQIERDTLEKVVDACTKEAQNSLNEGDEINRRIILMMVLLAGGSILITIICSVLITKSIVAPINEVKRAANEIANGKLAPNLEYKADNELGELADDVRKTAEILELYMSEIQKGLTAIGNGKLGFKSEVVFQGEFAELGYTMREIVSMLRESLNQINSSAELVSGSAEQVSNNAQILAQGASDQAGSVEELAVSINEIAESVENNAQNAVQSSRLADVLVARIDESNGLMVKLMDSIQQIQKNSNEITGIVKEVEDIAFQTNILALNASVEAARAGEAGRGFSVVAGEIRRLASKTTGASKLTAELIEKNIDAVGVGVEFVRDTAKKLQESVDSTQKVNGMVDTISEMSVKQSEAIAQVRKSVELISDIVQANSATSEESAAASEELSAQAQILKELVEQFEV